MSKAKEDQETSLLPEEQAGSNSPKNTGLIDRIWDFFSSMKLGLFLLLLIAVASIAGTLIPQNLPPQEYNPSLYPIYNALGLIDMYRSWWFKTLLFLLAMNLFICSFNRITPLWYLFTRPRVKVADGYLAKLNQSFNTSKKVDGENLAAQITTEWQAKGYRVAQEEEEGTLYIHADKGRYGLWGSFVTHIAFLVVLIGAVIGMYMGVEGRVPAEVGKTFSLKEIPEMRQVKENFQIKVQDFETVTRPDGSIQDWFSTLTVIEDGQEIFTKKIEVNDPLEYRGYKFYQSFYGTNIPVKVSSKAIPGGHELSASEGEFLPVPGTSLGVYVAKYVPDFDPKLGLQSKSNQPNNPRIVYALYKGREQIGVGAAEFGKPEMLAGGEAEITFLRYAPYTGLSVRKDPGVNTVWLGSGLMLIGMMFSFYMPHRRAWAIIEDKGGVSTLRIGGYTQKDKIGFAKEFEQLVGKFR